MPPQVVSGIQQAHLAGPRRWAAPIRTMLVEVWGRDILRSSAPGISGAAVMIHRSCPNVSGNVVFQAVSAALTEMFVELRPLMGTAPGAGRGISLLVPTPGSPSYPGQFKFST